MNKHVKQRLSADPTASNPGGSGHAPDKVAPPGHAQWIRRVLTYVGWASFLLACVFAIKLVSDEMRKSQTVRAAENLTDTALKFGYECGYSRRPLDQCRSAFRAVAR